MLYGIASATSALLLAALLTALLRAPLLRAGVVDRRRVRPVPLLGGAAVVLSTCVVAGVGDWTGVAPLGEGTGESVLLAAAVVAVLGAIADVWRLRTRFLVVGTAVAAAFVVPYGETGPVAGVAAVGWIAGVSLAFRGLDHADGLAGTVGVVTAFGAGTCAAVEVLDGLAVLLCVLAAALTGFLMHNWPPARVGLGASGSLFTGFLLASAGVVVVVRGGDGHAFASSTAVLFGLGAVAVADAGLVLLSRALSRRPLLREGPDHLAHRLRRLGVVPAGVVVLAGAGAAAGAAVAVLIHTGWLGVGAALWTAGGALTAVLGLLCVSPYGRHGRAAGEERTSARADLCATARRSYGAYDVYDTRVHGVSYGPTRAEGRRPAEGRLPVEGRPRPPMPVRARGGPVRLPAGTPPVPPARVTRSIPQPPPPRSTPSQTPSSAPHCV